MIKKQNKIIVAVSQDDRLRYNMIQQIVVRLGFALTPSDAQKIIQSDINTIDLSKSYFVFVATYNLRYSPMTTHRLYELSARGIAVVIGIKKLYQVHEFITVPYYPSDFTRP